ncbi:MAG TPA: hypothetical protein VN255_14555 [Mycobacterium sp.]|nr:hypothetical protein [Mycobacterium sp.]
MSIPVLHASGTYSAARRFFGDDDPRTVEAHRSLIAARVMVAVERLMADAPALTCEQVDQIANFVAASGIR